MPILYYRMRSAYILDVLSRNEARRPHVPDLSLIKASQLLNQYKADTEIDCREIDAAEHYEKFFITGFKKGFNAGTGREIENAKAPAGPYSRMCGGLADLKNEGKLVWIKRGVYSVPSEVPNMEALEAEKEVERITTELKKAKQKVEALKG